MGYQDEKELVHMRKKLIPLMVVVLILHLLSLLPGCGSADQEAYFRKVRDINQRLASRLGELGEEAAAFHHGDDEESKEGLAEILEEMARVLEEGVQEMGNIKVPVGGEESHAALLELLYEAAAGYRLAATALVPHAGEGEGEHGSLGEGSHGEEVEHPPAEETGESPQPPVPVGGTSRPEGH
ncbi:MAG: hypothetical protein ACUVT4_06940 [Actinomycetota bacterium]